MIDPLVIASGFFLLGFALSAMWLRMNGAIKDIHLNKVECVQLISAIMAVLIFILGR